MTFVLEFVDYSSRIRNLFEIDKIMVLNVKAAHFMELELLNICKVAENFHQYLYNNYLSFITYR